MCQILATKSTWLGGLTCKSSDVYYIWMSHDGVSDSTLN